MASREEMRQARLRAFEGNRSSPSVAASTNTNACANASAGVGSGQPPAENEPAVKRQATTHTSCLPADVFRGIESVLYRDGYATKEDILRWQQEGFQLFEQPPFGLQQSHGGPCGVLAVVQSELLRCLFFDPISKQAKYNEIPSSLTTEEMQDALATAMLTVLERAAAGKPLIIVQSTVEHNESSWCAELTTAKRYNSSGDAKQCLLQCLPQWSRGPGCLLFLASIVLTKGVATIRAEMDDYSTKLIGQFGHCNQELINLLLTGVASSNVFDGQMSLEGESTLTVRGVASRSAIGYLSHLEALRYCQVGNYLKVPQYPIWVIGSSSHFTVMFSLDSHLNEESESEKLLSALQCSFKAIDHNECGFIGSSQLVDILTHLRQHRDLASHPFLASILRPDHAEDLARLRGLLQVDGEIILWSNFWIQLSQLLSGTSLDALLDHQSLAQASTTPASSGGPSAETSTAVTMMPTANTFAGSTVANNGFNSNPFIATSESFSRPRSDSEVARELQAQFDAQPFESVPMEESGGEGRGRGGQDDFEQGRLRSDSELARELQAQWDAESGEANLLLGMGDQPTEAARGSASHAMAGSASLAVVPYPSAASTNSATGTSAAVASAGALPAMPRDLTSSSREKDVQEVTRSFQAFHYNGLRSADRHQASLTAITIVTKSSGSIGRAVTLGAGGVAGSDADFNRPLEEVLRTRWPGCVVSWTGASPMID